MQVFVYDTQKAVDIECGTGHRVCNWLHIFADRAAEVNVKCIGTDIDDRRHHGVCYNMNVCNILCVCAQTVQSYHICDVLCMSECSLLHGNMNNFSWYK